MGTDNTTADLTVVWGLEGVVDSDRSRIVCQFSFNNNNSHNNNNNNIMIRLVLLASLTVASALGQESNTGHYVHDTTGDHGPYYYWKLRQQGKGNVAPTGPTAPAVQAAHQRYIQPPPPQQHFQPAPAPAPVHHAPAPVHHAPAHQQYHQPAPAPVHQAPAPAQNNYHPQANPFQVDINTSSYAYTAPPPLIYIAVTCYQMRILRFDKICGLQFII